MAESLPAIRVTDPQAKDSKPTYPLSPENNDARWNGGFRVPDSPASKRDGSKPSSRGGSPATKNAKAARGSLNGQASVPAKRQSSPSKDNDMPQLEQTVTVDPVTQQILHRTGEMSPIIRQDSADTAHTHADSTLTSEMNNSPPRSVLRTDTSDLKQHRGKDHRVSFFSRMIGGKKKESSEHLPEDPANAEARPEGHDAQVFSPVMRQTEYGHAQLPAPDYIRVRTRHLRKKKHFDSLFLAQELFPNGAPDQTPQGRRRSAPATSAAESDSAWAAEFSKDGKYLATAGHDKVVRIWAVITTPEERHAEMRRGSDTNKSLMHTAAVFRSTPIREYRGHTSTILDLSWSKNNFLISSSMDKTVKLWHVTRAECLCTFKHSDYIPTIAFHPKDDRYFLAGSLDCKLRLWSIPDKRVAFWCQLPEMITAVAFTPDGRHAIAGCADGSCLFYETEGLRYQTQVRVKSAQSKHAKGAKITGIQAFHLPPNGPSGEVKLLITSNDSRVRLYNFRDKSLELKMKGSVNNSCQIRASMSDDGRYICCGSEDKRAYIWPLESSDADDAIKRPVEHFQAHDSMVTCVRFAPFKTRNLLNRSNDPIYDLCNPAAQASGLSFGRDGADSDAADTTASSAPSLVRQLSESPSRRDLNTCPHHTGNIVITASQTGTIKVFRQDCASKHRLTRTNSGKRLSSLHMTKHSTGLRSKTSSHSLQSGRDSTSTQGPSDRILSWRQDINTNSSSSIRANSVSSKNSTRSSSPPRTSGTFMRSLQNFGRTVNPKRSLGDGSYTSSGRSTPSGAAGQSPHLSMDLRMTAIIPKSIVHPHKAATFPIPAKDKEAATSAPAEPSTAPTSSPRIPQTGASDQPRPGSSKTDPASTAAASDKHTDDHLHDSDNATDSPTTSESANPLMLSGEQSNLYWNVGMQKKFFARAIQAAHEAEEERKKVDEAFRQQQQRQASASSGLGVPTLGSNLRPDISRQDTAVSRLSIERSLTPSTLSGGSSRSRSRGSEGRRSVSEDRGRARRQQQQQQQQVA